MAYGKGYVRIARYETRRATGGYPNVLHGCFALSVRRPFTCTEVGFVQHVALVMI